MAFRCVVALTVAVLTLGLAVRPSAQDPNLETVMRGKLAAAQALLEAVVRADFAAISRSADSLSRISETEIASWQAVAEPEYTSRATAFLLAVQALSDAAGSEDLDVAVREYTNLVSSCTGCHAYNRRMRSAAP